MFVQLLLLPHNQLLQLLQSTLPLVHETLVNIAAQLYYNHVVLPILIFRGKPHGLSIAEGFEHKL